MEPQFWLKRWTENEIGFHQQDVNLSLQTYWPRLGLPRAATVLVPLCGKSRDMLWLRAQGHPVLGIEFIPLAIRDFFAENGLQPKISAQPPFERWEAGGIAILRGDFFDLTAADVKDVAAVYDRAALIALPPALRQRYVTALSRMLPPVIESLLVTISYPQERMSGPPFAVPEEEVRALYAGKFDVELLSTQDALREDSPLRERGLTRLLTQVYRVRRAPPERGGA